MKVIDPGHEYELANLDEGKSRTMSQVGRLIFVKREGAKYPGNEGAHPGCTTQEVIRVLIHRSIKLNAQAPHRRNAVVLGDLRSALYHLEVRAGELAGDVFRIDRELAGNPTLFIEDLPVCRTCGHIGCREVHS